MADELARNAKRYTAAVLYVKHGLSQQEIAGFMGISKAQVCVLLQEAEQQSILIQEVRPIGLTSTSELEVGLRLAYDLRAAWVVPFGSLDSNDLEQRLERVPRHASELRRILGEAAAQIAAATDWIENRDHIGLGGGQSLAWFVHHLTPPSAIKEIDWYALVATYREPPEYAANSLVARAVFRLKDEGPRGRRIRDVRGHSLVGSLFPQEEEPAERREMLRKHVLELSRKVRLSFVEIGGLRSHGTLAEVTEGLGAESLEMLEAMGGVGAICHRVFDRDGHELDCRLNRNLLGLDVDQFRTIVEGNAQAVKEEIHPNEERWVVAVSGGSSNREALAVALKTRMVNVLVTDLPTATWLEEQVPKAAPSWSHMTQQLVEEPSRRRRRKPNRVR